jgi:hypothetical protein
MPDDSQKFMRVAYQRFEEARFLFDGERYAASIYLAGYAVECGLKALILSTVPRNGQKDFAESFRGSGWHNFNRLLEGYIERGGLAVPVRLQRPSPTFMMNGRLN